MSVSGDDTYKTNFKISMFYFSYVGSTVLQKFNDFKLEDLSIQFVSTDGRFVYEHPLYLNDLAVNGNYQLERQRIATPAVVKSPPPVVHFQLDQSINLECVIRGKGQFHVAWYYSPDNRSQSALVSKVSSSEIYSDSNGYSDVFDGQSKVKVDENVYDKGSRVEYETKLEIGPMGNRQVGSYVCEFKAAKTSGDVIRLASHATMD